MARPKKVAQERRTETVAARFTVAEAAIVESQAAAAGMTVSEYVRVLALTQDVKPRKTKLEASLLVELNRIGVNINQLAHAANAGRTLSAHLQAALADLEATMRRVDASL